MNRCVVSHGKHRFESQPLTLEVNKDLPYIVKGPTSVNDQTFLTLKCRSGNPRHNHFQWFKNDILIPNTNTSSKRLKFKPFKFGDDGVYTCEASDGGEKYQLKSEGRNLTAVGRYQLCKCPCPPGIDKMIDITEEQLQAKVKEIETTLTLDATKLSKQTRKKQAAENKRKSAIYIGSTLAISVLSTVLVVMVGADAVSICLYIYKKWITKIIRI